MSENKEITKFKKKTIDEAVTSVTKEFFASIVALLLHDKSHRDITFVKTPVETPDGGLYLVSILHVQGPKIDLEGLTAIVESQKDGSTLTEEIQDGTGD